MCLASLAASSRPDASWSAADAGWGRFNVDDVTHTSSLCLLLLTVNRLNAEPASNLADYDESHAYTVASRVCGVPPLRVWRSDTLWKVFFSTDRLVETQLIRINKRQVRTFKCRM